MIKVTRYQDGYIPVWADRVEDCYIWKSIPRPAPLDRMVRQRPWNLRVNESFSVHRTLREARIEAARVMGIRS